MELYDSPVLLILNATPSVMASELPIRVFETEIDIVDGMVCMHVLHFFSCFLFAACHQRKVNFSEIHHTLANDEAERIGINVDVVKCHLMLSVLYSWYDLEVLL